MNFHNFYFFYLDSILEPTGGISEGLRPPDQPLIDNIDTVTVVNTIINYHEDNYIDNSLVQDDQIHTDTDHGYNTDFDTIKDNYIETNIQKVSEVEFVRKPRIEMSIEGGRVLFKCKTNSTVSDLR